MGKLRLGRFLTHPSSQRQTGRLGFEAWTDTGFFPQCQEASGDKHLSVSEVSVPRKLPFLCTMVERSTYWAAP